MRKLIVLSIFALALFILLLFNQSNIGLQQADITEPKTEDKVVTTSSEYRYGISTSDQTAGEIAQQILDEGGTAVDAAVALSYALGVTEPYGSGIGGGGGMMIKLANSDEPIFLDYREVSDKTGEQRNDMMAIPSFVYAMDYISEHYGTMPIAQLIQPSIELAANGFAISDELAHQLDYYKDWIYDVYPEGYDMNNNPLQAGELLKQNKLATILKNIAEIGPDYFYTFIKEEMDKPLQFGIDEIKDTIIRETEPLQLDIGAYTFYAPKAPFSGETTLQIIKGLEQLQTPAVWEGNVGDFIDLFKITRNSYAHRFHHIGDPNFVQISDGLTEETIKYITTNEQFDIIEDDEPISTTHFSIIDGEGNIVSATNTLGNFFGHKQNELGFFFNSNLTIASPNSDSPNKLEPYKRSRTFMSPLIFENEHEIIALGSPGGSRIPEILAQVIHSYLMSGDLEQSVGKLRISVLNDNVAFENYIAPEIATSLDEVGYRASVNTSTLFFGGINAIGTSGQEIFGVADSRRQGTLLISE